MPIDLTDVRKSPINWELCEKAEQVILDALNTSHLSLRELILVLAQTLIDVGGSLESVDKKLTYDEMWRRYAVEPTLGNALMAQGTDMLYDWIKLPERKEKEEGEKNHDVGRGKGTD